jgi:hypothetical protein
MIIFQYGKYDSNSQNVTKQAYTGNTYKIKTQDAVQITIRPNPQGGFDYKDNKGGIGFAKDNEELRNKLKQSYNVSLDMNMFNKWINEQILDLQNKLKTITDAAMANAYQNQIQQLALAGGFDLNKATTEDIKTKFAPKNEPEMAYSPGAEPDQKLVSNAKKLFKDSG